MQDRFKQLLKEKQLTATHFATLIKVNASAMSHILNGRSKPGFDVLDKIGQAFPDINLNWLICGKGAMYNRTALSHEEKTTKIEAVHNDAVNHPEVNYVQQNLHDDFINKTTNQKHIKRIILFFEDGSFEDYKDNSL